MVYNSFVACATPSRALDSLDHLSAPPHLHQSLERLSIVGFVWAGVHQAFCPRHHLLLLEERVAGTAQGLADLDAEIVEPQDDVPLPSASTGGPRPLFASSLHLWRGSLVCTPAC